MRTKGSLCRLVDVFCAVARCSSLLCHLWVPGEIIIAVQRRQRAAGTHGGAWLVMQLSAATHTMCNDARNDHNWMLILAVPRPQVGAEAGTLY